MKYTRILTRILPHKDKICDSVILSLYERIRENTREYERIRENTREYERIRENTGEYERIRENTREYERIRENTGEYETVKTCILIYLCSDHVKQ